MKDNFLEILSTEITYTYEGEAYSVTASNGEINVVGRYDDGSTFKVNEDCLEYWVGALVYWYEESWDHAWTENDYRVAAHVCQISGHIMSAERIERVCGISYLWGYDPKSFQEAEQALKLIKHRVHPASEGAD